ncbi:hypothetical protein BaRGS_00010910 [Batillaria attramentaria]|uniref:Transmembrane protein 267 n=1 Tax=Batillaria attramentaria TaxID=370345 RepID=A0ABD0LF19_9CAEN
MFPISQTPTMDLTRVFCNQVLLFSLLLAATSLIGDKLATRLSQADLLWRALQDSITHGVVGMLSWAVVETPGLEACKWMSCVVCGILASAIDVDHFLAAKSLQLQDAVNLKHRPPFHSTSLVLMLTSTLWCVSSLLPTLPLKKPALLLLTAWLSHHLRDANRRGLWFPPIGSSPPLPSVVYIGSTVLLAVCVHYLYVHCLVVRTPTAVEVISVTNILTQ